MAEIAKRKHSKKDGKWCDPYKRQQARTPLHRHLDIHAPKPAYHSLRQEGNRKKCEHLHYIIQVVVVNLDVVVDVLPEFLEG